MEIVFLAVKESYESVREGTNAQLRRGRKTLTFADVGKITSELNMMFLEEIETYHTYAVTSTIGGNTNAPFLLRLSDECYASVRDFSTEDSSWRLKVEPAPGSETLSALPWFSRSKFIEIGQKIKKLPPLTSIDQVDEFISKHDKLVHRYNEYVAKDGE